MQYGFAAELQQNGRLNRSSPAPSGGTLPKGEGILLQKSPRLVAGGSAVSGNYFARISEIMVSTMDSARGRWKGPLKVEPLVLGMVGRPSRRR